MKKYWKRFPEKLGKAAALSLTAASLMVLSAAVSAGEALGETSAALIPVNLEYDYDYEQGANGRWVYTNSVDLFVDDPETPEGLAESLWEFSGETQETARETMQEYLSWLEQEEAVEEDAMDYFYEHQLSLLRADTRLISFCDTVSSYGGGTHPGYWYDARNYDSHTGELLTLQQVLRDPESLPELLAEKLRADVPAEAFLVEDLAEAIREEMKAETYTDLSTGQEVSESAVPAYTLGYDGITFWFSPYELTSYAAGGIQETLRYEDYPELVREEYLELPDAWMTPLEENREAVLADGSVMSWRAVPRDEYGYEWNYAVTVNGVTREQEEVYAFDFRTYLARRGGQDVLITECGAENDYRYLLITDLSGLGEITSPEQIPASEVMNFSLEDSVPMDPEWLLLGRRVDMLSTYTCFRRYRVGDEGSLEPQEDWYRIDVSGALTTKRRLGVDEVDYAGVITGSRMLAKGTELTFFRTDGESWVDMSTEEGDLVRLYVTDEWPITVNGLYAPDVFDGMMFAG